VLGDVFGIEFEAPKPTAVSEPPPPPGARGKKVSQSVE
jgi:hypothetical protein